MTSEVKNIEGDVYVPGSSAIDISPEQNKGVLKEIIKPGEGDDTPCNGNKVSVHYTGKLIDGTKFDSSVDRGEMFQFTVGKGEVIKAWDIGVASMKKGEKCLLTCHPDYAYGQKGSPPKIPENATLVFEVELFQWEMEDLSPDNDKGILRSVLVKGEGFATPGEGATVEVHLIGRCSGKQFEERDMKFEVGDCAEAVVTGIEIAVQKFKKGEKSKLILAPKYAFGFKGNAGLNVPSNSTIEYEMTLVSFEKEKETWNMSSDEKLEQSEIVKSKGTNYFKSEKYETALKHYGKIISYLQFDSDMEGEAKEKKNALLLAGYLNVAACQLKLEKYDEVIQNCEKALELEPNNTKGLFRKGQAHLAQKDHNIAKQCFIRVLEIDESNKAAKKNAYICQENMKQQLEKEKKMYQTMFKKMAEQKDEEPDSTTPIDSHSEENGLIEKMETDDGKEAAEAVEV